MGNHSKHHLPPILFLTLGWFGIEMAMALDTTKFQVMLDQHLDNALMIGLVLSLGPLAGITVQPLMGRLGDHLARRGISRVLVMKLALAMAILSTVAFALPMGLGVMVALVTLFFISFNVLNVNYRALITETSNRRALLAHKGTVSGGIALFSGLGGFAMFVLCSLPDSGILPFVAGGLILLLTFVLMFMFAPEPKPANGGAPPSEEKSARTLFGPWNLLFYAFPPLALIPAVERKVAPDPVQQSIFRVFLVVFFSWLGIQALRGYFVLFATKTLGLTFAQANLPLAVLTLMIVTASLPLGKLADRMDNRLLYRGCLAFYALTCLSGFFWVHSLPSAMMMSMIFGAAFAGMIVLPLSLLFKLCPPQTEGTYAGLYNLFMSVPQLYSLYLTGWLIDLSGDYRIILLVGFTAVSLALLLVGRIQVPGPVSEKILVEIR